jgi:hypothetical protein
VRTAGDSQLLSEAASDVLESMCFLGVAGVSDDRSWPQGDAIVCSLEFWGDGGGSFGAVVAYPVGLLIAENFLGQPSEEISRSQVEEVLCELANMICGSFLSGLRTDAIFDLSHPRCEPVDASRRSFSEEMIVQTLDLEEGRLLLWVEVNA